MMTDERMRLTLADMRGLAGPRPEVLPPIRYERRASEVAAEHLRATGQPAIGHLAVQNASGTAKDGHG